MATAVYIYLSVSLTDSGGRGNVVANRYKQLSPTPAQHMAEWARPNIRIMRKIKSVLSFGDVFFFYAKLDFFYAKLFFSMDPSDPSRASAKSSPTSSHSQVGGSSRTECVSLGCTILVHPKMASIRGQINEPRDGHVAREVDSRAFSESSPFFRNQRTKLYPPIPAVDANKRYVRINVEMNVEISLLLSSARTLSE